MPGGGGGGGRFTIKVGGEAMGTAVLLGGADEGSGGAVASCEVEGNTGPDEPAPPVTRCRVVIDWLGLVSGSN